MPAIPGLGVVTVEGTFTQLTLVPATGAVVFTPSFVSVVDADTEQIVYGTRYQAQLVAGELSIDLPCSDGTTLPDWHWNVSEYVDNFPPKNYSISIPQSDAGLTRLLSGYAHLTFAQPEQSAYLTQETAAAMIATATLPSPPPSLAVTYNGDGSVATVSENGVVTSLTYNGDGSVATSTRLGVVQIYVYSAGNLVSVS